MHRRRVALRGLAVLLTVLLSGCFEPPVRETVAFRFDERGGVEVVFTTRLETEESYKENAVALQRLVEAREAARCGEDPFTRQLERLSPAALHRALSSREGELRESVRSAAFPDARALERLFEGAPLYLAVVRAGNEMQLEILAGRGGRATVAERLEVSRELDRFSAAAAGYLNALADLWAWLDEHPGEDRLVVGALLGVDLPKPAGWVRDEREEALADAVLEAMSDVQKFFRLEGGRAESLDEVSRKAYDPFPAPLWVHVNGTVLESTGFLREEDGSLRVPPVSLWGALSELSGRWVTPDPLAEILRREERPRETPPDVDLFLARGRRVSARPSGAEVRGAIEAALVPAPVYRLRWRLPGSR